MKENMMEEKIELQVNLRKQFQLLKNNTFKDPLCFVDENVQNAQRAGAKNVHIEVTEDKVVFVNDGEVLKNHAVLFNMGESSWDDEVMEKQTPFGLGFFSNISISEEINITSGDKITTYKEEGNEINIYTKKAKEELKGFKLEIKDYNKNKVKEYEILERAEDLGKYVQNLNIFVNGKIQEKVDISKGGGHKHELVFEEEGYKGFIYLNGSTYFSFNEVSIYHNGRIVKKINDLYYLNGEVHIDNTVLNLESPDRKDIIKDDLYHEFIAKLRKKAEEMVLEIVNKADEEFIKKNELSIAKYIDYKKVAETYQLNYISGEKKGTDLTDYAMVIEKNDLESVFDLEKIIQKEKNENQKEKNENQKEIVVKVKEKVEKPEVLNIVENEQFDEEEEDEEDQGTGYISTGGYRDSRKKKEEKFKIQTNKKPLAIEKPTFWIEFKEIPKYKDSINVAKKHDVIVYIVQNEFEKRMLSYISSTMLTHINELQVTTEYLSNLSNLEMNDKEDRAYNILGMLSKLLGFEENVFVIGDLMVTEKTKIETIGFESEEVSGEYNVIADKENNKIYVDRTVVDTFMLKKDNSEELTMADIKFILWNLENILKEISLLDGKIKKSEAMKKVLQSIAMS